MLLAFTLHTVFAAVTTHIQNDLVQKLQCVAQEHKRHDPQVDLAAQLRQVDLRVDLGVIAVLVQILPRIVDFAMAVVDRGLTGVNDKLPLLFLILDGSISSRC